MSLFNELKRRNVFRVGIAYVVAVWLVLQVLQLVLESFGTPDWVMKTALVFAAAGFPFALFFAWAFELTPEGLKREHEVDRSQSITPNTGRKLDYVIIAALVVALAYFTYDKFVLSTERDAALIESVTQAQPEPAATPVEPEISDKSIAVLPFVNMSDDASNEFFSDGLSEELLNMLAKIPELRVISRSSAFSYKGKDFKISDVGRELNVSNVLEGSVRKFGNQIRITAQLIETSTDTHLWSETYDRTLDNIFTIQDEIAATVVDQLKITLLGAAPKSYQTHPDAYALYLQGRHLNQQGVESQKKKAQTLLEQTLKIDPQYAAAWNELAEVYASQANLSLIPLDEGRALARSAVNRALLIDPDYAPAHAQLGYFKLAFESDLQSAVQHAQRALQLDPSHTDSLDVAANLLMVLRRFDEAIEISRFLLARDPVSATRHRGLGFDLMRAKRPDEAIPEFEIALSLSPQLSYAHFGLTRAYLQKGDPEKALAAARLEVASFMDIALSIVYATTGQDDELKPLLAGLIEKYEKEAAYNIAYIYALRGDASSAFEWLDKALLYQDSGLQQVSVDSLFDNIRDDARWVPFLERAGFSPSQLAAIKFDVTLPE